jgi:hypothetical protein
MLGSSWVAAQLAVSQEGLSSVSKQVIIPDDEIIRWGWSSEDVVFVYNKTDKICMHIRFKYYKNMVSVSKIMLLHNTCTYMLLMLRYWWSFYRFSSSNLFPALICFAICQSLFFSYFVEYVCSTCLLRWDWMQRRTCQHPQILRDNIRTQPQDTAVSAGGSNVCPREYFFAATTVLYPRFLFRKSHCFLSTLYAYCAVTDFILACIFAMRTKNLLAKSATVIDEYLRTILFWRAFTACWIYTEFLFFKLQ